MQVISFKNTVLFKRGIWLSAAALIAFAVAPSALDGSLRQNPASGLFAAAVLGAFFVYLLWKTQFHRLADEVLDCEDHLKVRRGRIEVTIPFSKVAAADVSTGGGIHRITVRLREPTRLGGKIEFLPQASLWSNLSGVKRLASGLTERANQAHRPFMPRTSPSRISLPRKGCRVGLRILNGSSRKRAVFRASIGCGRCYGTSVAHSKF